MNQEQPYTPNDAAGQGPQQTPPYGQYPPYGQQPYGYAPQGTPEQQEKARTASILLRIGGWLDIVSGALSILLILLLVFGSAVFFKYAVPSFSDYAPNPGVSMITGVGSFILIAIVIALAVGAGIKLWFGIVAVKHHADNQKVQFLYIAGIIQAVFAVLGLLGTRNVGSLLGLAAAGTYLAGAIMQKQLYRPY